MADPKSKVRWEQENVVKIAVKINKNQNPELYRVLANSDQKSSLARSLMQLGLDHYLDPILNPIFNSKDD